MKIVGNASFKKFRYSVNADLELSFYQWKTLLNVGGIQFFKKTCARVNFFLPGQTNFVQTVFFVQSFFFLVETVTEISGSQFFKDHILTNVTDFLTSGNHFFPFSSDSSQLLSVEAVYSSAEAYFLVNPSFRLVKSSFLSTESSIALLSDFFC